MEKTEIIITAVMLDNVFYKIYVQLRRTVARDT